VTTKTEQTQSALLANVDKQRRKMHRKAALALIGVLGVFAAAVDVPSLRSAVNPDAHPATRKQQATADLTRQATVAGVIPDWSAVNQDAQATAQHSGAAAAGHVLTRGDLPVEPDDLTTPDTGLYVADGRVLDQLSGVGADAATALGNDVDDAELVDLMGESPGALYYLDLMNSRDFLDTTNALYATLGVAQVNWSTMLDERVCQTCDEYEARSPYDLKNVPEVPHGMCRCWTMPA